MKTNMYFSLFLMTFLGLHSLAAQSPRKVWRQQMQTLTQQTAQLSDQQKRELKQLAFKIHQIREEGTVLFVDETNVKESQLAMVWLQGAFYHFEIPIPVASAGTNVTSNKPLELTNLTDHDIPLEVSSSNTYQVSYNNRKQQRIAPTSLSEWKADTPKTLHIEIVKPMHSKKTENLTIAFPSDNSIPLFMTYLAQQVDALKEEKY